MPDWIIAVILGIIEGITEFIPVSSTGHLLITEKVLQMCGAVGSGHWLVAASAQKDLFNIVIQCGAVLAVIPLFHKRFHQFIFQWREKATQDYMLKILVAFVITGAIGFILEKEHFLLTESLLRIAIALLVGGIAFLIVESRLRGKTLRDEITWPVVIAVGLGQILAAVFPGTSRSGATIVLALLLGLNRPLATEFSFLVGIPTMLAAGALKIFKALHHPVTPTPREHWEVILISTIVAAIVSFIAVKWMLRYVQTHTFNLFGWYRIALGLGIFILLLAIRHSNQPAIQTQQEIQRAHLPAFIAARASQF